MTEIDLTPHPRILSMLGEINLEPWRCIAELIDNSIDGFLKAKERGILNKSPKIWINIPTTKKGNYHITLNDNGPGMNPATLSNSVRAGWTSNSPFGNMGMFGMGFNIATARIGVITQVWSTESGDNSWHGVEIDFEQLQKQDNYKTKPLRKPKNIRAESGTQVIIKKVKPEHMSWFLKSGNRNQIKKRLAKVYSSMIGPESNPVGFTMHFNNKPVEARRLCIWSEERSVIVGGQTIPAYMSIDRDLGEKYFCYSCWNWQIGKTKKCENCNQSDVKSRHIRIKGWLGVLRYTDPTDFGIDFLRNGRKIEMESKEFFSWDAEGRLLKEYSIEDPRGAGRIVGEIHLDHCRVSYTKDKFDRGDPHWVEMCKIIRGDGPFRPMNATKYGFPPNESPLGLIYKGYKRHQPTKKNQPGYKKYLALPSEKASDFLIKFNAGDPEYQSDDLWWAAVEAADERLELEQGGSPGTNTDNFGSDGSNSPEREQSSGGSKPQKKADKKAPVTRKKIAHLSGAYFCDLTRKSIEVSAFHATELDPKLGEAGQLPWSLEGAEHNSIFIVNTTHDIFDSLTMNPLDALITELAKRLYVEDVRDHGKQVFASILANLRAKYVKVYTLDVQQLQQDAKRLFESLGRHFSSIIEFDEDIGTILFEELLETERDEIEKAHTKALSSDNINIFFLEYASPEIMHRFVIGHPEYFMDGTFWPDAYEGLDFRDEQKSRAQQQVLSKYRNYLDDAYWVVDTPTKVLEDDRVRLQRAMLSLELLLPESDGA
ncbi:MAG: ATP-binding protein [Acidobacteriota bacterium]|nr:ATP-binding protein [Acidobacteriota bacterium]